MQFTVEAGVPVPPKTLPTTLANVPALTPDRPKRILIQNVQLDDQGRVLQAELDGQLFHEATTELPSIGSTDDWQFVNTTPLDHNKHVHLIQFQLIDRRADRSPRATGRTGSPSTATRRSITRPSSCRSSPTSPARRRGPNREESGWKDTIRTPANMATRIRIRWAIQLPTGTSAPGVNTFPDSTRPTASASSGTATWSSTRTTR